MNEHSIRVTMCVFVPAFTMLGVSLAGHAQTKTAAGAEPDVLVVSNGDTLHGKIVSVIDGKLTFHTDALGDVKLGLDKVKELHSSQKFAVLTDQQTALPRKVARQLPTGALRVENQAVIVQPENAPAQPPIPVAHAMEIMDAATLDKQVNGRPGFLSAWSGSAVAGATLVAATQNQYSFSGGVDMVRRVPTVDWLQPRNRTLIDFTGSFGKITQRSYTLPGPPAVFVPAVTTKTSIFHAGAERDWYLSARTFLLVQALFDHNFSQDLALQQIYGGGIGWTPIKTPNQELDLKATLQYARQQFISHPNAPLNLIGSTLSADYVLRTPLVTYTQGLAYLPAFNNSRAWSVNETNMLTFPAYKNFGFSMGTLNSYLNFPPAAIPPTKRNSFQFTMGLTYAIKSRY
jgi:hypothetical protein